MSAFPPPPGPSYRVSAAFDHGWTKFWAHLGPFLVGVLTMLGVLVALVGVGMTITSAGADTGGIDPFWFQVLTPLLLLVGFLLTFVVYGGLVRAALDLTDGRPITGATVLRFEPLPQLLLAALLVGLLVSAGTFICIIPGLVIAFFTQFTAHFVIDEGLGAIEAMRASFTFVNNHLGPLLGFFLASLLTLFVGSLLCGLGLVLAIPVQIIASAYTYRTLPHL